MNEHPALGVTLPNMFARPALVCALLVACSGATPPLARVAPAAPAAAQSTASPAASSPAAALAASASPEPAEAALPAPERTELLLSDGPVRDIVERFDSAACTSEEATKLEIEIRINDAVWDTLTVATANPPAACADYGRKVELGDYNFDGHEDLAVPVDNGGSYGGPTYAILLFQPLTGHYVEAPLLSTLTRENLGLFQVDPKRKRLVVYNKSGCCIHYQAELTVNGDAPSEVSSSAESVVYDNEHNTCQVVLDRTGPDGKTKTTTHKCNKDDL